MLRVLVRGWTRVCHSYALVNINQVEALQKYHSEKIQLFQEEVAYFDPVWTPTLPPLDSVPVWKGEEVDVVYNISFPHQVALHPSLKNTPQIVFFTSEYKHLPRHHFVQGTIELAQLFVTPSEWSKNCEWDGGEKPIRVIPHGVRGDIFFPCPRLRAKARRRYGYIDGDKVLLFIGAMSPNKGTLKVLETLCYLHLVEKGEGMRYKLFLKASSGIYPSCRAWLQQSIEELSSLYAKKDIQKVLRDHVLLIDSMLPPAVLNALYNMADIYFCPYYGEAFNMPVLESLSAGTAVCAPNAGPVTELGLPREYLTLYACDTTLNGIVFANTKEIAMSVMRTSDLALIDKRNIHTIVQDEYSWKSVSLKLCKALKDVANID